MVKMDLYKVKTRLKLGLLVIAALIIIATLYITSNIASQLKDQEVKKVELLASTYQNLFDIGPNTDLELITKIIKDNRSIPIILTDENMKIISTRNLPDTIRGAEDTAYQNKQLDKMMGIYDPIEISLSEGHKQYLYYRNSSMYEKLKKYPYFQLLLIGGFLLISYLAFSFARRGEQNLVWVGMSKETAHQLGTPISSLVAWTENLKEVAGSNENIQAMLDEMEHDIERLELVADRFSKIGSDPVLTDIEMSEALSIPINYMKRRSSDKVEFKTAIPETGCKVAINAHLFNWVVENILKNALDSMNGEGSITLTVQNQGKNVVLDIQDSGSGIPRSKFKTVFQPGYSTKRRGWGLGLSLSKRIIRNYHKGKIFVLKSSMGVGTVFRISLPSRG